MTIDNAEFAAEVCDNADVIKNERNISLRLKAAEKALNGYAEYLDT